MAITPLTVTIDLNPSYKKIPAVYVSQLDNNLRELAITVQDGGVNYDVASSGYDVYVEGTKPDKHGFSYKVTDIGGTVAGSVITVPMQTQMTCVKGMVSTEIVLKSGSDRIGSANFLLVVERAGLDEDTDVSETDIPGYIDGAQRAAEAAEDAKDLAVAAKDTAVAVAASIPEDYTTLSNDVDDLKSAFEQLPTSIQPDMTVGSLMSEEYTEEKMPYLYRVAGGGVEVGKVEADKIVGGSVAWNQLATNHQTTYPVTNNYTPLCKTASNQSWIVNTQTNHVYYLSFEKTSGFSCYRQNKGGLAFGYNLYDDSASGRMGAIGKCTEGTENADISGVISKDTTTSEAYSLSNVQLFDLTQMFGSAVADYIYSLETATAGAGVAVFRKMFPNAYYPYNAGELMHVSGVSEHVMTGKNLVNTSNVTDCYIDNLGEFHTNTTWSTSALIPIDGSKPYILSGLVDHPNTGTDNFRTYDIGQSYLGRVGVSASNGYPYTFGANVAFVQFCWKKTDDSTAMFAQESTHTAYEPYKAYTYPLDSSLTLRGIPKLDSANNLYYDGDVYSADGKVQRKYGIVDLGTLNWQYLTSASVSLFRAQVVGLKTGGADSASMLCEKYPWISTYNRAEKTISQNYSNYIDIIDSTYTDAASFKTAMSGVYLVYELATPTTETAEPYEEYQHVTNGGTEEYVSTGIVPVGHSTKYYGDIGSKVDKLPSDFSNIIAPTESAFKATRAYTVNDLLIVNNVLYKVTANIANGATITVGTNVQQTTLSALIKALSA